VSLKGVERLADGRWPTRMHARARRARARAGRLTCRACAPGGGSPRLSDHNPEPTPARGAQVSLKRERLELSPVYATAVAHGGHTLGYIRLVNFGAHAAADMEKAMDRLEARAPQNESVYERNVPRKENIDPLGGEIASISTVGAKHQPWCPAVLRSLWRSARPRCPAVLRSRAAPAVRKAEQAHGWEKAHAWDAGHGWLTVSTRGCREGAVR